MSICAAKRHSIYGLTAIRYAAFRAARYVPQCGTLWMNHINKNMIPPVSDCFVHKVYLRTGFLLLCEKNLLQEITGFSFQTDSGRSRPAQRSGLSHWLPCPVLAFCSPSGGLGPKCIHGRTLPGEPYKSLTADDLPAGPWNFTGYAQNFCARSGGKAPPCCR